MDVTDNDLLLVRVKEVKEVEETDEFSIEVMNRLTGDFINKFPSMCHHDTARVSKYPQDQDYALECCNICKEIFAHNINTLERFSVHKGTKIIRMCEGPAGSLLAVELNRRLHKLEKDKTQQKAQLVVVQDTPLTVSIGKKTLKYCYAECNDIFMYTVRRKRVDEGHEIIAVKLGSNTIVWRLFEPADSHVYCIACDTDGNAYVGDQGRSRILKINSLTGEILSILLFEEEMTKIHQMCWSNKEPNLTLKTENQISTFYVPK